MVLKVNQKSSISGQVYVVDMGVGSALLKNRRISKKVLIFFREIGIFESEDVSYILVDKVDYLVQENKEQEVYVKLHRIEIEVYKKVFQVFY